MTLRKMIVPYTTVSALKGFPVCAHLISKENKMLNISAATSAIDRLLVFIDTKINDYSFY
jgi:hypothetical protein